VSKEEKTKILKLLDINTQNVHTKLSELEAVGGDLELDFIF
jgi:hypothetical protein